MSHTAVIAGVGPGLGAALARRFVAESCQVGLFSRSSYAQTLAEDIGEDALGVSVDVANRAAVHEGFATVRDAFGPVDVLVVNASASSWDGIGSITPADFERALSVNVTGALHCSQAALPDMRDGDGGTIIFTGATSALRGRDGAVGFSAAKFAARGMAESMARDLGPEGIHVAHVVIDGQIRPPEGDDRDPETYLDPDAIADSYWHLVGQDRSAWTLELDLRPHVEEF